MKEFTFHYGRGTKSFSLDESKIIKEIRMPETPVMEDIPKGVLEAIYNPIGTEPIDKIIKPGQNGWLVDQQLQNLDVEAIFGPRLTPKPAKEPISPKWAKLLNGDL